MATRPEAQSASQLYVKHDNSQTRGFDPHLQVTSGHAVGSPSHLGIMWWGGYIERDPSPQVLAICSLLLWAPKGWKPNAML